MIQVIDRSKSFKQNGRKPKYWKSTPEGYIRVFEVNKHDLSKFIKSYNSKNSFYKWFVCAHDFTNPFLKYEHFAFREPVFYGAPIEEQIKKDKKNPDPPFTKFVDHETENISRQYGSTDQLRQYPTIKNLRLYGVGMPRHLD